MAVTVFSSELFPEEGVRGIKCEFKDDDGVAVIPNADTIKWTLTDRVHERDETQTVINSREDVAVTSAATIYITLKGDDLALQASEVACAQVDRVLTIKWQYNSTNLGNNIEDKAQFIFSIENLYKVT